MHDAGISRRALLHGAAVAGAAITLGEAPAAFARRARRPTVAVLGGGMAGLTAAHELA